METFFRVTGHLCGEFTGPRGFPHTKASDAEFRYFLLFFWKIGHWWILGVPDQRCLIYIYIVNARWRHERESISALLALHAGNPSINNGCPSGPVIRSFDISFDVTFNTWLKNSVISSSFKPWRSRDVTVMDVDVIISNGIDFSSSLSIGRIKILKSFDL